MSALGTWLRERARHKDIDSLDNRSEALIQALAPVIERTIAAYHRAEVKGVDRVPSGGALFVANHNSFAYMPESYLLAAALYRRFGFEAVPFGLMHEVLLDWPVVNQIMAPLGAVRASHDNGERLLRAGNKVLVFPGGDVDALRPFRDRHRIVFDGRSGFVRLALRAGVPVVPVVAAGAHSTWVILHDGRWLADRIGAVSKLRVKAWPLTLSFPWGLTLGPTFPFIPFPSKILMEVMAPIHFAREGDEAADDDAYVQRCAGQVREAMQQTLTRLVKERG